MKVKEYINVVIRLVQEDISVNKTNVNKVIWDFYVKNVITQDNFHNKNMEKIQN